MSCRRINGIPDRCKCLDNLGTLYVEVVESDVHPGLLQRLGGTLSLAGQDAWWIRVEKDAALGFIDMARDAHDVARMARNRWVQHRTQIVQRVASGVSPARAVEGYMRSRGTIPHSPDQMHAMLQQTAGGIG
jgi:hypothetical protein